MLLMIIRDWKQIGLEKFESQNWEAYKLNWERNIQTLVHMNVTDIEEAASK